MEWLAVPSLLLPCFLAPKDLHYLALTSYVWYISRLLACTDCTRTKVLHILLTQAG